MSIGFWQIIFLIVLIAIWFGCYALGVYICEKNKYLKKNINKTSIILISLILLPIIMAITKEGLAFGLGWAFVGPFALATLIHWIYPKIIKSKIIKPKIFFNERYFYGYFGYLILAIINLLTYS